MTNELIKTWMTEAGRKLIDTAQIAKRFGFDRCDVASDAQWIEEDNEVRITFTLHCYREPITEDPMSLIVEDPTTGDVVVKFGAGGAVSTFISAETIVKNSRFAKALADNAAQALAVRELRIPGVIETMDEITFDWHYRHDRKDRITRSTVAITDEIRDTAKRLLAEWTA